MQDISCLGQCSMTVALPVLSACGCETCILPTMVLSTHTGGLGTPTRRSLTEDISAICDHWIQQGIRFDGIYVGYLGKTEQIQLVTRLISQLLAPGGVVLVDPAMADNGKLYSGLDEDYAREMRKLCEKAHIITPNWTEASLLAQMPYKDENDTDDATYMMADLRQLYGSTVVLTGVRNAQGHTSVGICDGGQTSYVTHRRQPGSFHGTGDLFASALFGKFMTGCNLHDAAVYAVNFVSKAIANTVADPAHAYGVKFETALRLLWE